MVMMGLIHGGLQCKARRDGDPHARKCRGWMLLCGLGFRVTSLTSPITPASSIWVREFLFLSPHMPGRDEGGGYAP